MKKHAQDIIDKVQQDQDVDEARKEEIIEKINEWKSDANAESNSLAMTFEKYWMELRPILAEMGLI